MTAIDLLSLTLSLRPLPSDSAAAPRWWGRAAHALLLQTAAHYNPTLAEALHESPSGQAPQAARPFTASTLYGRFNKGALDPQAAYTLRLTALTADLTAVLLQAAQDGPLAPGQVVELDRLPFQVTGARPRRMLPEEDSGHAPDATSYQELSAPLLLARRPAPRRLTLRFTSPTTFKSGGKHLPIPLPELVFGSLLERWNAFAPLAFPPEARRYAAECLAVSRYRLSSRSLPTKDGGLRFGAQGEVTYTSLNYDRYWMSVIGVLAEFARFAGVGAGTAAGMGQCRLVEGNTADEARPSTRPGAQKPEGA